MDLLLLGAGIGVVGGAMPSPLHMIALGQLALKRWAMAVAVLVGAPLLVDAALLLVTLFFFHYIPSHIAHAVAYVGGVALLSFATYSLLEARRDGGERAAKSAALTLAGVSVAVLAELAAPGTWIYWLTIAGPILNEGKLHGYWHVVPFFLGSMAGYYGAAMLTLWLMAWGAGLYQKLKQRLFLVSNVLLLVLAVSYLLRAYWTR